MSRDRDQTPDSKTPIVALETKPRMVKVLHWVRGERALATALTPRIDAPRPLAGLEVAEQLSGLLASTSAPHAERVKRLAPSVAEAPIPLLAAARSLRFYLPLEGGEAFELEANLLPDPGDLVVVHFEGRLPTGERALTGELRYLLVPATGDHTREVRAREALKMSLGFKGW